MQAADLLELRDDLPREARRLEQLVESLLALESRPGSNSETVEAAALRLHSFYTGVERMSQPQPQAQQYRQGQQTPGRLIKSNSVLLQAHPIGGAFFVSNTSIHRVVGLYVRAVR